MPHEGQKKVCTSARENTLEGNIAKREAVTKAVLVSYGVKGADALGYAVVLHVALWLPITLLGACFMTREGIKWSASLRMEKEAAT